MTMRWRAHQGSDLKEICKNADISKAPAGISSETKLALKRKRDDYLPGPGINALGKHALAWEEEEGGAGRAISKGPMFSLRSPVYDACLSRTLRL